MKDETADEPIVDFLCLRPKMYSFEGEHINADGSRERFEKPQAKGIERAAAENIYNKHYIEQLKNPGENYALNRGLGSRLQQNCAIEVISLPLSESTPCSYSLNHSLDLACRYPDLGMSVTKPPHNGLYLNMSSSVT